MVLVGLAFFCCDETEKAFCIIGIGVVLIIVSVSLFIVLKPKWIAEAPTNCPVKCGQSAGQGVDGMVVCSTGHEEDCRGAPPYPKTCPSTPACAKPSGDSSVCKSIEIDSSCEDSGDVHNLQKCLPIIVQLQDPQRHCSPANGTGCQVETVTTVMFSLNIVDTILAVIFAIWFCVSITLLHCYGGCGDCPEMFDHVCKLFFKGVVDFGLTLSAFIVAAMYLPAIEEFREAACFTDKNQLDSGDVAGEIKGNLEKVLATGIIELVLILGNVAIELYLIIKSNKDPNDDGDGATKALIVTEVVVELLECTVTCIEFYYTWQIHSAVESFKAAAKEKEVGEWCYACLDPVDTAAVSGPGVAMIFTGCVITAII